MKHIYYRNDFAVEVELFNFEGVKVSPPEWKWSIEFSDSIKKYVCSLEKGNAEVMDDGSVMCYLDNHNFYCGRLSCKFKEQIPNLSYLDGFQRVIRPTDIDVELWDKPSDNDGNVSVSVIPDYVIYDAWMIAKANGYTGTAEEFYDALNHIVDINKKEAERVEAEANRVNAEQQRVENFVAMESALTTSTSKANTATNKAEEASKMADNSATAASQARVQATLAANGANAAAAQATQAMEKTNKATELANTATANAINSAVNAGNAATEANEAAKNANDATEKAKTATTAAEQSAERANTAADNADVATSNATTATTQATTATKRANDISADLEAKREADYWRGAKGDKGDKGDTGAKGDRGEKGDKGERGLQGVQGVKGDDGVSPTVSTSKAGKVTTIEITDAQGTHTATVNDGESVEVVQSTGTSTTSVMSQKAVSDALSNVYTKSESDAMLAEKQNVLTAGNGITIADDVISVDDKKFTVWSNPRIDEYVTTFTNFGYNDDGTQKTSGSSVRSWVFKIGNYGHKEVYFNTMNAWMCDGIDEAQNMINPTFLGESFVNIDIGAEHIGKYIVAMSMGYYPNLLGTNYCRSVMFLDEKTQAELDADERMLSDMYAGNLMRYAVATSAIDDKPTLEWVSKEFVGENSRNVLVDIVSRPNIAYECKVAKNLDYMYQGCGRLIEITPLWDTSLVTTMRNTFQMCRSLKYADLTHLDMGAVTDVGRLFDVCISLIDAKLPPLPSVKSCANMFYNCSLMQSVTLPSLPSVTNCLRMFIYCSSLQSLYLDIPNCENFEDSFYGCNALHTIEIVDVRKATYLAFQSCSSLKNITCVEELPKCTINLSWSSKLTLDSATNIITHLPDLSGEDSKTLALHATTKALLTESLIAEATNKNWIIA